MTVKLRAHVILLIASLFSVMCGVAASAAPSPNSGPTTGGTNVTFEGLRFIQISSGYAHTLGLTNQGTVFAWGHNFSGQLGDGSQTNRSYATPVLAGAQGGAQLSNIVSVSAGRGFSLALSANGELYAWGLNDVGQLGDGTLIDRLSPVKVTGGAQGGAYLNSVASISAGDYHALASTTDGSVFAFGDNYYGTLGDTTRTDSASPVHVVGPVSGFLSGISKVATATETSAALSTDGHVYTWGLNSSGELGIGSTTPSYSTRPNEVVKGTQTGADPFLHDVIQISAGGDDFFALTSAGLVFGWGANGNGSLGNGSSQISIEAAPSPVISGAQGGGNLHDVISLSSGLSFTAALMRTGEVYTWGQGSAGQLGNGASTLTNPAPVKVLSLDGSSALTHVTSVSAGAFSAFTINESGEVFGWGSNAHGLLGEGGTGGTNLPVYGPSFVPTGVTFGGVSGTQLTRSGSQWSIVTPPGTAGTYSVTASAAIWGGTTASQGNSVSFDVGTFLYIDPPVPSSDSRASLAETGSAYSNQLLLGGAALLIAGLLTMFVRTRARN